VLATNDQSPAAATKHPELVKDSDAPANVGGEGGPVHPEPRRGAQAEDEDRTEQDVDAVGEPQGPQGDRSIAGTAKCGVDHEQQHDGHAASEHEAGEPGSRCQHPGRGSEQGQQAWRKEPAHAAKHDRQTESEKNPLHCSSSRTACILGARPPCHHGTHAHGQAHGHRVDNRQEGLRQADGRHRIGPELRHPEDISHREHRLHHHFEHHGYGKKQDCSTKRHHRQVTSRAGQGFANQRPEPFAVRGARAARQDG
jgi:hypothetical protein